MSKTVMPILSVGSEVHILEFGKVIDVGRVISDKRSEIEIESLQLHQGSRFEFAYFYKQNGWKLLFEGMGGERCISDSELAPVYQIEPKT